MTLPAPQKPWLGATLPMYLGLPGALQRFSRVADAGYQSVASRGEALHQLISGGTVVTKLPKTKRIWSLPFSGMTEDTANTLLAFYTGTFGPGPFGFVDPAWRNKIDTNASTMGAVTQSASSNWVASAGSGTLGWDGTITPAFPQSDVMTWTGAGNGSQIALGSSWSGATILPRTLDAPLCIADQNNAGSIYLTTASGSASVTVATLALSATGTSSSGVPLTGTINSGTWTRFTCLVASATLPYLSIKITCNTSSAPVIWASCADIQNGIVLSTLMPWVVGLGSPRVVVVPTQSSGFTTSSPLYPYRNQALTLAEI